MAEKLSRIIRENEASKAEITRNVIHDIKKILVDISRSKVKPEISFELDVDIDIALNFERKLTFEQNEEQSYNSKPVLADEDISHSDHLTRLFTLSAIDKDILRKRIKDLLNEKSQITVEEVIEQSGGLGKGLAELFGYLSIVKEFKHLINPERTTSIVFDKTNRKSIQVPEIIMTK